MTDYTKLTDEELRAEYDAIFEHCEDLYEKCNALEKEREELLKRLNQNRSETRKIRRELKQAITTSDEMFCLILERNHDIIEENKRALSKLANNQI